MKKKENPEDWEYIADAPQEYEQAIKNATSDSERRFFEKLRYKVLHETAASNDVLMNEKDNEEGLYMLRVGTDDILLGKNLSDPNEKSTPIEIAGLFQALEEDIFPYIGRHITLWQWLRDRDYKGIRYDANNDYN